MSGLSAALWAEALKARRSRVPLVTALGFALTPLMGGLFMVILKDPALAHRFGLLTTKAQLTAATGDWPTYFGILAQATAVGGAIVFGMIAIWIFGREYSDRTIKDLLALPTSRQTVVVAKGLVLAIWALALVALIVALGLGIGGAIGLPGWSTGLAVREIARIVVVAALTIGLVTPVALAASVGRGYLPGVGFIVLTVFFAQLIAALGWGAYFPWSVPALLSGLAGTGSRNLGIGSYLLVVGVACVGFAGTLAWWLSADQS